VAIRPEIAEFIRESKQRQTRQVQPGIRPEIAEFIREAKLQQPTEIKPQEPIAATTEKTLMQRIEAPFLTTGEIASKFVRQPIETIKEITTPKPGGIIGQALAGGVETATFLPDIALKAVGKKPLSQRIRETGMFPEVPAITPSQKTARLLGQISTPLTPGLPGVGTIGGKALKTAAKGVKSAIKEGVAGLSKVRSFAVKAAFKDKSIITQAQPSIIEVGDSVINNLEVLLDKASTAWNKGFSKLSKVKGKSIDTLAIKRYINKQKLDPKGIRDVLSQVVAREQKLISPTLLDRVVAGKKIGAVEAKTLNSILSKATRRSYADIIGEGLTPKLGVIKSKLLGSIEKTIPGTKIINKKFSKRAGFIQDLDNKLFSITGSGRKEIKEGVLKSVGEQFAGIRRTKSVLAKDIKKLDRLIPKDNISKKLVKSLAAEECSKTPMPNLLSTLRVGFGAGIGARLGGVSGAFIGGLASEYLSSPGITSQIITGAKTTSQILNSQGFKNFVKSSLALGKPSLIEMTKERK